MPAAAIIVIVVIVVVVVAAAAWVAYSSRQRRLRQRFGGEYDRLVAEFHSRRKAEAELADRQRRVRDLGIRPLDRAAQARYSAEWAAIQGQFVDTPQGAVGHAQRLLMTLMNERGYPTEDEDQMLADLSVDHANVLDHFRVASSIARRAGEGTASTEDLRQAVIHYRVLFRDLVDGSRDPGEPSVDAEPDGAGAAAAPLAGPADAEAARPRAAAVNGSGPAEPPIHEPATHEPVTEEPAPGEPVTESATDGPAPDEPATDEASPAEPATDEASPAEAQASDVEPSSPEMRQDAANRSAG